MKCQDLFSLKKKKMSSIAVVIGTRRGNICYGYSSEAACRGTSNEYTGDFIENILSVSIFIRLSVECRESNQNIPMSSQRSLHQQLLETNTKRFYIAVLSIAQFCLLTYDT